MGLPDWLGRGRRDLPDTPVVNWRVYRQAADLVVEDGRGASTRVLLPGARTGRVVPLTGGNHHPDSRGSWLVAHTEGDELTEKMFSRVGLYSPAREA